MAHTVSLIKRGFATSSVRNVINNVTIIGGGLMGSGIAQVSFALIKYDYNVNFIIRIETNN